MTRHYAPYPYGERSLSDTLSDLATSTPKRFYASIPKSSNLIDGFIDVTFDDMERMVNALAVQIESYWGKSSNFETVAYLGIPDLRSVVVFFAAVRNGYKLFLPSPRNGAGTNISLLNQTTCLKIVYASEVWPLVQQLGTLETTEIFEIPSFDELYHMQFIDISSQRRPFSEIKDNPILILHSSGSTGLPKPVVMTNGTFAVLDYERFLPTVPGRANRDFSIWDFENGGKFYTIFPYFHLAGFLSLVVNPVFTEASSPVLGPPLAPPSGLLMKEVLKQQNVKAVYIPPSLAEQLLAEPDGLSYFEKLDFICYTGGPFCLDAGKKLVQVTALVPLYGSTEAFQTPQLVPAKEDWAYMEWNPHFKHRMDAAEDGAYEIVLLTDESTKKRSALNHNFPGVSEWHTRDLFMPHPTKKNLWRYYGRRDDIIVFSNGEKFNPVSMELIIGSCKLLSGVLVIGQNHRQAGLILELKGDTLPDKELILKEIGPLVERANTLAPAQGRIVRSKICIVPQGTLVRAGKGTVIRKLSEKKLHEDIDQLYAFSESYILLDSTSRPEIDTFIQSIVADAFSHSIGLENNLFDFGLDSIKSVEIVRNLKAGIKNVTDPASLDWVTFDVIYRYPSIHELSKMLSRFFETGEIPTLLQNTIFEVDRTISEYTENLARSTNVETSSEPTQTLTVALTGSNGSLGSGLLERLLGEEKIQVLCLNRRHDEKHEARFADKARFIKVQLHEPNLGLSKATYNTLLDEIDIIIHNAWQVDFSLPLKAFRAQLLGVRHLVDFSLESRRRPRIVFCSSVSSVMNWPLHNPASQIIPEEVPSQSHCALDTGYGASKFVAESILSKASAISGINISIVRLGQIVQPGDFSLHTERMDRAWVPGFLQTTKTLGSFPTNICDIDWISLDEASSVLAELVLNTPSSPNSMLESGTVTVYNIVNPSPCTWMDVFPQLHAEGLVPEKMVTLVEWLAELHDTLTKDAEADINLPSSKIIPFFYALGQGRQGLKYEMHHTLKSSSTLRSVSEVRWQKIKTWLK